MNDFLDFVKAGIALSMAIFGQEEFVIDGKPFLGDLDFFDSEKDLMEAGGFVGTYNATIMAPREQFEGVFAKPLERALDGVRVKVKGREMRIVKVVVDPVSVTLHLANPSKGK